MGRMLMTIDGIYFVQVFEQAIRIARKGRADPESTGKSRFFPSGGTAQGTFTI